jgi:hypothetical protein
MLRGVLMSAFGTKQTSEDGEQRQQGFVDLGVFFGEIDEIGAVEKASTPKRGPLRPTRSVAIGR